VKSYYIESLGCPKNLVDSEVFASVLQSAGYEPYDSPQGVDLVLVNTCAFIKEALAELDDVLTELEDLKSDGAFSTLVVTGCVTKRGFGEASEAYPFVDAWIPLKDFSALAKWLGSKQRDSFARDRVEISYHRYLRISDGCDNHCSYCTIPSIRGSQASVPVETLVKEAELLARDQVYPPHELVLIAQDTCNYGLDLYSRKALPELIEKLHAIPSYQWIRLMYMHPDHFEPEWLGLWERFPKLLPYFEIPIQHSEDRILRAMNRRKGRAELATLFDSIRTRLPQAVFRTSLITGFPGEKHHDVKALQEFIRETGFTWLGVFAYSREEGTPAAGFEEQVTSATAHQRRDGIMDLQAELTTAHLEKYIGSTLQIILEYQDDYHEEEVFVGRAWFQAPDIDGVCHVHGTGLAPGMMVSAEVVDVIGSDLFCELTTSNEE
jgi:ribosomal protein S12 methylthiotransferase